jgi:DNA-binding ferritin-like protein
MTKICSNCSTEKEIGEFYLDRGKPHSQCKECIKTKTKKYKDNNKEKYQKYFKEYQEKNKEELKEYKRKNYLINQEKIRQRTKDYYENNKQECDKKQALEISLIGKELMS